MCSSVDRMTPRCPPVEERTSCLVLRWHFVTAHLNEPRCKRKDRAIRAKTDYAVDHRVILPRTHWSVPLLFNAGAAEKPRLASALFSPFAKVKVARPGHGNIR